MVVRYQAQGLEAQSLGALVQAVQGQVGLNQETLALEGQVILDQGAQDPAVLVQEVLVLDTQDQEVPHRENQIQVQVQVQELRLQAAVLAVLILNHRIPLHPTPPVPLVEYLGRMAVEMAAVEATAKVVAAVPVVAPVVELAKAQALLAKLRESLAHMVVEAAENLAAPRAEEVEALLRGPAPVQAPAQAHLDLEVVVVLLHHKASRLATQLFPSLHSHLLILHQAPAVQAPAVQALAQTAQDQAVQARVVQVQEA